MRRNIYGSKLIEAGWTWFTWFNRLADAPGEKKAVPSFLASLEKIWKNNIEMVINENQLDKWLFNLLGGYYKPIQWLPYFHVMSNRAGQFTLVSLETFELQSVLCPELEPSVDLGERRILVYLAIAGDLAQKCSDCSRWLSCWVNWVTGSWFGTWILCSIIYGIILPID